MAGVAVEPVGEVEDAPTPAGFVGDAGGLLFGAGELRPVGRALLARVDAMGVAGVMVFDGSEKGKGEAAEEGSETGTEVTWSVGIESYSFRSKGRHTSRLPANVRPPA